jgi:hypothetical protein
MTKQEWSLIGISLFLIASIAAICIGLYRYNTYYVKDVEVTSREIMYNTVANDYPDFFITIQKNGTKAKLEVDREDYNRIIEGQHINASIKKSSGYMRRYQLVMESE